MVKGKAGPRPGPVKKKDEKPAVDKKPRKVKAAKADPSTPAPQVAGANSVDRDRQALAIVHRDHFIKRKAALSKAQRELTALKKTIKEDGFTAKQIQIMADLQTPEGEAAVKLSITQTLEAARWASHELGSQLDMFMEPNRTPAVDMAFEEGIQDAMSGKTAKPGYDPSVPQHARYMEGFHAETERRLKAGIGSDVKPNPTRAETLAAARAKNAEVPSPPVDQFN